MRLPTLDPIKVSISYAPLRATVVSSPAHIVSSRTHNLPEFQREREGFWPSEFKARRVVWVVGMALPCVHVTGLSGGDIRVKRRWSSKVTDVTDSAATPEHEESEPFEHEEQEHEANNHMTSSPPPPSPTIVMPPPTQQGPYLRRLAPATYHLGGPSSFDPYAIDTRASDKYTWQGPTDHPYDPTGLKLRWLEALVFSSELCTIQRMDAQMLWVQHDALALREMSRRAWYFGLTLILLLGLV
ncbi:hypothetical protein Tco_0887266 [Tanacetum coccineum]